MKFDNKNLDKVGSPGRQLARMLLVVLITITGSVYADTTQPRLEQKIGQMLMVGFNGTELKPTDSIVQDILAQRIGGVVLYGKDMHTKQTRNIQNPEQLKKLTRQLQHYALQAAQIHHNQLYPLLIAVDYEGGKVVNLIPEKGFPATFSAAEIAKMPPQQANVIAEQMADTLQRVGINLDFAPVLDVNVNPENPVIAKYGRSFSADPNQVALYAGIFSQAFYDKHILCVYKHFPGHGSSTGDSHAGLVDISQTWKPLELIPYKKLFSKSDSCSLVMPGHLVNHQLDSEDYPASLSYKMVTGLLRQQLGFKGAVVTDDLQMGAILQHYDLPEIVRLAIQAGDDILLFSNQLVATPQNTEQLMQTIREQVQAGKIDPQRIEQGYEHVMTLKQGLEQLQTHVP